MTNHSFSTVGGGSGTEPGRGRPLRVAAAVACSLALGAMGEAGAQSSPSPQLPRSTPSAPSSAPPAAGDGLGAPRPATAGDIEAASRNRWLLQTSVYTRHFHPDPQHVNHQRMVNLEYQRDDDWLGGVAFFRNSFGQPSQYLYLGKLWRPFSEQAVHVKLTGGLLHGYKDEFRDKIPFNKSGVAPALLPSIGYSTRRFTSELILFGTNGMMFTLGVYLN
ncbi:MAG TPA: hypothetical protein PKA20_11835 [Burkholderiaceae bacterium]|nr:hypothetical protein [Burkholderiaceae bacterium]